MHGYKKPKNEWSKKKSNKKRFNDYEDDYESVKKSKRYYRDHSENKNKGFQDDDNEYDNYK